MTEEEIRKKLAPMKSVQTPKGYWENYGPRLQAKLARAKASPVERHFFASPFAWAVPAFAAMMIGIGGYWLGHRSVETLAPYRNADLQLASYDREADAQKVFSEMLSLFPDRINWVSFIDGKVDFSISSTPAPQEQPLIPFMVTLSRPAHPLVTVLLLRPGQEALVHIAWDAHTTLDLKAQTDASGKQIQLSGRLSDAHGTASIEGTAQPNEKQSIILGSLRWNDHLIQMQVARLSEKRQTAAIIHEDHKKIQS